MVSVVDTEPSASEQPWIWLTSGPPEGESVRRFMSVQRVDKASTALYGHRVLKAAIYESWMIGRHHNAIEKGELIIANRPAFILPYTTTVGLRCACGYANKVNSVGGEH